MSATDVLSALRTELSGTLHLRGEDGYAPAPWNSSAVQAPAAIVKAAGKEDVAATVRAAGRAGLVVVPQATGHGARSIDQTHVLLDTSALSDIVIDPDARTARVGPGAVWSDINAAACEHGLVGLAGSAATVGATSYTLLGGLGFLVRAHGVAAGHLRYAEFVDGRGEFRRAAPDGDVDALWACRGGGGVGVVTEIEFGLVPGDTMHGGFRLWPIDALAVVARAWATVTPSLTPAVSSAIGVAKVPPTPALPQELHGKLVVRVLAVSSDGAAALDELWTALGDLPPALLDTSGPADNARLAALHMDPPGPVPSRGYGRWLTAEAERMMPEILTALGTDPARFPAMLLEVRHVASDAAVEPGAQTKPLSPYLVHYAGGAPTPEARDATDAGIAALLSTVEPVDAGLAAVAFCARGIREPDTLPDEVATRVHAIHERVDPDGVIHRPSTVT